MSGEPFPLLLPHALDRNALATLETAALQDVATVLRAHALAVSVDLAVLSLLRLIGAFRHIWLILAIYEFTTLWGKEKLSTGYQHFDFL